MLANRNHWRDYLKETEMKKEDIRINGYYSAKVNHRLTVVRIIDENPEGGWNAINTKTGKRIRIKSPAALRGELNRDGTPVKEPKTVIEATEITVVKEDTAGESGGTSAKPKGKATKDTTAKTQSHTGQPGATGGKKLGCLNAAVEVLKLHPEEPLNCKRMIELMAEHGLWQSKAGATPHNTLYAAILREINTKGDASRFEKVERGSFKLKNQS